jgi:hypothetical protein
MWPTYDRSSVLKAKLAKMPPTPLKRPTMFVKGYETSITEHKSMAPKAGSYQSDDSCCTLYPVQRLLSPHQGNRRNLARESCQDTH